MRAVLVFPGARSGCGCNYSVSHAWLESPVRFTTERREFPCVSLRSSPHGFLLHKHRISLREQCRIAARNSQECPRACFFVVCCGRREGGRVLRVLTFAPSRPTCRLSFVALLPPASLSCCTFWRSRGYGHTLYTPRQRNSTRFSARQPRAANRTWRECALTKAWAFECASRSARPGCTSLTSLMALAQAASSTFLDCAQHRVEDMPVSRAGLRQVPY